MELAFQGSCTTIRTTLSIMTNRMRISANFFGVSLPSTFTLGFVTWVFNEQ